MNTKKYIFLILWTYNIISQTQYGTVVQCQAQYNMNVEAAIKQIAPTLTPNQRSIAIAYMELVKLREQTNAEILFMERSLLYMEIIQGALKMPYDNYANCIELGLVNGQTNNAVGCEKIYQEDVIKALNKAQCILNTQRTIPAQKIREILAVAPKYIVAYRKRAEINAKLLVLERQTILNLGPVSGILRKPYDAYDQCRDPKSIIPFRYN